MESHKGDNFILLKTEERTVKFNLTVMSVVVLLVIRSVHCGQQQTIVCAACAAQAPHGQAQLRPTGVVYLLQES